jgi:hypothetical protein
MATPRSHLIPVFALLSACAPEVDTRCGADEDCGGVGRACVSGVCTGGPTDHDAASPPVDARIAPDHRSPTPDGTVSDARITAPDVTDLAAPADARDPGDTAPPDAAPAPDDARPEGDLFRSVDAAPLPPVADAAPSVMDGPRMVADGPPVCTPVDEICNGLDEDCDGTVDEGVARPCGSDVGECELGYQTCQDGTFDTCVEGVGPTPELCDNRDNDCDGERDEADVCVGHCGAVGQPCCGGFCPRGVLCVDNWCI